MNAEKGARPGAFLTVFSENRADHRKTALAETKSGFVRKSRSIILKGGDAEIL